MSKVGELDSRTEPGDAILRRVIRAADILFKNLGFRAVTMEAVARDAAVSKATLYSRFKNKDELFLAVCAKMAERGTRSFDQGLVTGRTIDERLFAAVFASENLAVTLMVSSPHAEELFSAKAQLAGDIFVRANEYMLARLTATIKEDPALRPRAPRIARAIFFGSRGLAHEIGSVTALESELRSFVMVYLAGARSTSGQSIRDAARSKG